MIKFEIGILKNVPKVNKPIFLIALKTNKIPNASFESNNDKIGK